jgi:hypothetical protein
MFQKEKVKKSTLMFQNEKVEKPSFPTRDYDA